MMEPGVPAEPRGAPHRFAHSAALSRGLPGGHSYRGFGPAQLLPVGGTIASGLRRDSGFLPYAPHGASLEATRNANPVGRDLRARRRKHADNCKDFGICWEFASLSPQFPRLRALRVGRSSAEAAPPSPCTPQTPEAVSEAPDALTLPIVHLVWRVAFQIALPPGRWMRPIGNPWKRKKVR